MKRFLSLMAAACVSLSMAAALADSSLPDGVNPLPIDFSAGMPAQADGYLSETEYQDPSIHVVITTGRYEETDYWQADVTIADPSQLRTLAADGFDSNLTLPGTVMAQQVNAILAMAGDYYCYRPGGYILRQGQLYTNEIRGIRDVLVVDEDGDFHVAIKADSTMLGEDMTYEGKKIINAFFFGPILVKDGQTATGGSDLFLDANTRSQRCAICQVGHLSYRIVCTGFWKRGSRGMTLDEFRSFLATQYDDIIIGYNMDGGDSTQIIFRGAKVNDVDNPDTRDIADIVYFASAYSPEAAQ